MRHARVIYTVLAAILLLGIIASGCKKYSEAEWQAGQIWFNDPAGQVCRHRVAIIAKGMMERGEKFDLVFGELGSKKHVWIEEYMPDGSSNIIEPSQRDSAVGKYKEVARMPYEQGACENILVISTVNRWLYEKGMALFHPTAGQKREET